MALNFPDNPTVGQQYIDPNGNTWEYTGVVWNILISIEPGATGPTGATGLTGATGPAPTFDLDPITAAIVFGGGGLDEAGLNRSSQRVAELEEQIRALVAQLGNTQY